MIKDNIRFATSIPSLKNKIQTRIEGPTDAIYWYIRFNIPLDETTVSGKTMDVTDTEGYIMRTDILYNKENNFIVISPLDTYEQNRYYLLNIYKKVKSARGQFLRSDIHILFKLLDNQISEYKILKQDVKIPKARPRPHDYDRRQINRPLSALEKAYRERTPTDRMTTVEFSVNVWVGLVGILLVLVSLFLSNIWVGGAGFVVCVSGLAHIYLQLRKKELRSTLSFNRGVRLFNKEHYAKANEAFRKAQYLNPDNELVKYALYKVNLYLS